MESNISDYDYYGDFTPPSQASIYSYFISLIIVGTIGNILIIVAFSSDKKLRRVTANFFIVHLAVVNLFTVAAITPLYIYTIHVHLNATAWKFRDVTYPTTVAIALESLMVIAFNRYLLIRNSRKAYQRLCTGRAIPTVIIMMWTLTITNAVPLWITYLKDLEDNQEDLARLKIVIYLIINVFPTLIIVPIANIMTLQTVAKSRMRVAGAGFAAKKNTPTSAGTVCVTFASENAVQGSTASDKQPFQGFGLKECHNCQKDGKIANNESFEIQDGSSDGEVDAYKKSNLPNPNGQLHVDLTLQPDQCSSKVTSDTDAPTNNSSATPEKSPVLESPHSSNQNQRTNATGDDGRLTVEQPYPIPVISPEAQEKKENNSKKSNLVQLDKPKILRVGRGELKLMRLMLAMFSLLLISWVPALTGVFRQFEPSRPLIVLSYFAYLNPLFPSLVPYIYLWSNVHFQKVLVKRARLLFTICCRYTKATADRPETTFY